MTIERVTPTPRVHIFDRPEEYDSFLKDNRMGGGYDSRAKGMLNPDGTIDVAIDREYYQRGGIKPEQLPALIEHERTELTTKDAKPQLAATIAEYRYIFDHFGERGLVDYHSKLCNLMGGSNDDRNSALKVVMKK